MLCLIETWVTNLFRLKQKITYNLHRVENEEQWDTVFQLTLQVLAS